MTITKLIHVGNASLKCIRFSCTTEPFNKTVYLYAWSNSFSTVGFKLNLERDYNKHMLSYYFPSLLIVLLSWISFVIPPEVIPGRMALLITLILVLVNMFVSVIEKRPPAKATVLDIWMLACLIFVSGAVIAYAALLLQQRFHLSKKYGSKVKVVEPADKQSPDIAKTTYDYKQWDKYFLIGFPLAALTFNLIYWPVVFFKR